MRLPLLAAALAIAMAAFAKDCPQCRQACPDESLFCATCGQKFQPVKTCPGCSRAAFDDARFCPQCGHKFGFSPDDEQRLVNEALKAQGEFVRQLQALSSFYRDAALREKQKAVEEELAAVNAREALQDLKSGAVESVAGALGGKIEAVPEADRLFAQAEASRRDLDPFRRQPNLLKALETYQALLLKFPQSDKVDECAYYMGQVYASSYVSDWAKAAAYYEKCALWNPKTDKDARFRAAEAYEKARNAEKAEALYRLAAQDDPVPENRETAKERLKRYARR